MDDSEIEDEEYQEDRLSELPKSLILLILSFLPMRDVVSTTLLSKSWENLWTTVPCLNFGEDTSAVDNGIERFRNFVNRALILWEGTKILKFEINTHHALDIPDDIDLWVRFAVKNKVEELNIYLGYIGEEYLGKTLRCLNSCSSLRKLSIWSYRLQIHGSPAWNRLKYLKMTCTCFSEHLVNQILLGSPKLEVLDLHIGKRNLNLNIESASLKTLSIRRHLIDGDDYDNKDEPSVLKICCPNLETFGIYGKMFDKCLLTNLSSLTDATLGFNNDGGNKLFGEILKQILTSIRHVEKVTLSLWNVEVLDVYLKKYLISPFPNVKFFKLDGANCENGRLAVGINLLEFFPNIKMLVIKDINIWEFNASIFFSEFETSLSKSVLGKLKTIDIDSDIFTTSCYDVEEHLDFKRAPIFKFVEFVLKHALELEKLVIRDSFSMLCESDLLRMCSAKIVLNMPKSSPTAKVIFKSSGYRSSPLMDDTEFCSGLNGVSPLIDGGL